MIDKSFLKIKTKTTNRPMETIIENKIELNPDQWMVRHRDYLIAMARRKLPEDNIEDIIQDTFLAALNSASGFRGRSSERVWLTSILNHKIMDHYRMVYSNKGKILHSAISISEYPTWYEWEGSSSDINSSDITDCLNANELHLVLDSGINLLGSREQQVLRMKIKGCSTDAICQTLDINKINVWVALSRARKKMKSYLAENW
ncbi:hypothetical protein Musp01_29790 [Muricauda sp. NBRC 101325]|nr:hypothetical protein Musp01_29790 [Muricauda sp. NBRC 101325]